MPDRPYPIWGAADLVSAELPYFGPETDVRLDCLSAVWVAAYADGQKAVQSRVCKCREQHVAEWRGAIGEPDPAVWLVISGIISVQFGAAIAKDQFHLVPPTAMVWLRLISSAVILLIMVVHG